jgi:mRNA interferase HicA
MGAATRRLDARTYLSYPQVVKGRELIRKLRRAGVEIEPRRGGTGHWQAHYRGRSTSIPLHGDTDLGPHFVRRICKQLGLDPKEVL